jgi:hypothetical protein
LTFRNIDEHGQSKRPRETIWGFAARVNYDSLIGRLDARLRKKTNRATPSHPPTHFGLHTLFPITTPTMAAGPKLYPRATVKKIIKAHSKRNVSKNVDVLVRLIDASYLAIADQRTQIFLDYALFLQMYATSSLHGAYWGIYGEM